MRSPETKGWAAMSRCIILDSAACKARRVLAARLAQLGVAVVCKTHIGDYAILTIAEERGCVVVTTDRGMARLAKLHGFDVNVIVLDIEWARRKSARDIATRIIKLVFGSRA